MKEVMETTSQIVNAQAAAGSGDFSRVAFEYSPEMGLYCTGATYSFYNYPTLCCKFIAPKSGLYKYEGSYKTTSRVKKAVVALRYEIEVPIPLKYWSDSRERESYLGSPIGENYAGLTIGNLKGVYQDGSEWPRCLWNTEKKDDVYAAKCCYFIAQEGQGICLYWAISPENTGLENQNICFIKNQKVTY